METIFNMIVMLVGGLVFFLFGMNVMSDGLETMAGGKLEKTMKKVTANDFLGFFLLMFVLQNLEPSAEVLAELTV